MGCLDAALLTTFLRGCWWCIRHTELVLEQVKLRHDDAAMAAVQEGTRHVIRLCLRQMTMQHRALLDRIIAQVRPRVGLVTAA